MKFVIVSPRQGCGGPIVLHLLCKLLVEKGFDARIFYVGPCSLKDVSKCRFWLQYIIFILKDFIKIMLAKFFPRIKFIKHHTKGYGYIPVRNCKRKFLPFIDSDTIVVYPEMVYGNFLQAQNVIRWFLYFNQFKGLNAYGKNDLFFSYREIFNDRDLNPTCQILNVINFDYELYKKTNFGLRKGTCYIIRKGKNRKDLPKYFDGPVIDTLSEPEIINVFNQSAYCISYDTQTFYSSIASICGCVSIIVPEPGKTRANYIGQDDRAYGVAYGTGENELEYAKSTLPKLMDYVNSFYDISSKNVDDFMTIVLKYFPKQ